MGLLSTTLKLTKRMRVKVGINTTSGICLLLVLLSFSSENLQVRVVSLEERCDELEQYSHCNMVRIRGLTETANEDTDGLVKHLAARWLAVKIEDSDVVLFPSCGKESGGPIDTP